MFEVTYSRAPLYEALSENIKGDPISFHVPGHKYGKVFSSNAKSSFHSILELDGTEIGRLDDLHAPEGVIKESQELASSYFESDETFFLVNGSTAGNLAMVLSVCKPGEKIIIQRNCHKSVMNGIELAGACPIFLSPLYEEETNRYSKVSRDSVKRALEEHPDSKGVLLTYPDYFGRAYELNEIADLVHAHKLPLLIDEAHGVHFHLDGSFPTSAMAAGADVVVQSAHKMAPAMTMASYLHVKGDRVNINLIRHYLQMVQSSSPSYPLMASLDLARAFMEGWGEAERLTLFSFIEEVREAFGSFTSTWRLLPVGEYDDPLKLTLEVDEVSGFELSRFLEEVQVVPELATSHQVLLILGLEPSLDRKELERRLDSVDSRLKNTSNNATIREVNISFPEIQTLEMGYADMQRMNDVQMRWSQAVGCIAAEAIIPYPPGIPLLMKGERISKIHYEHVLSLIDQGARFQNVNIEQGLRVFKGECL
ncbi:aminotransferase class I/II-fold pyridoxal phosphate-dependent enzyme [Halobacillus sp. H74]|uniref:aminotransferase class I/II-fold pyridoxal phosphate-dependent enzyme n=1 Tax=Halobacillus sp. H74 TaxID=3457436 RepID=UPI003FCDD63F